MLVHEHKVGIDTLDVFFVTGAIVTGNALALSFGGTMFQLSRKFLIQTEHNSKQTLAHLFATQPQEVWVLSEGVEVSIPFEQVQVGDIVVVGAGESIPVDGTITEGIASIDQRALTGESQPAQKGVGELVFASTTVLSGKILIEVEKTGEDTISAQIAKVLNNAESFTQSIVSRGDRIADISAAPLLVAYGLSLPFGVGFATTIINSNFGSDTLACRQMRAEAKAIIKGLRERNIKSLYILTGDVEMPTKKLAQRHACVPQNWA